MMWSFIADTFFTLFIESSVGFVILFLLLCQSLVNDPLTVSGCDETDDLFVDLDVEEEYKRIERGKREKKRSRALFIFAVKNGLLEELYERRCRAERKTERADRMRRLLHLSDIA